MLHLNNELTYFKDKDFINYCMGVFRHNEQHDYNDLNAYYSDEWGMKHFTIDYNDEEQRKMLSKLIFRKVKNDEEPYNMFRCDFDWRRLEMEKTDYEKEWEEIRTLFDAYCRTHNTVGFIFTHFSQQDEEHYDCYLCRHIHIVYRTPMDEDSFSEFVLKHIA
jgi:hypothetical protein